MKKRLYLPLFFVLLNLYSIAQTYTVNGNAFQESCNCYRLTPAAGTQHGSVWNNTKIDLSQSFDFVFDIYLGDHESGADGIAFVMQPISTSVGTTGNGMGFAGISPSIGITLDTYQNSEDGDPFYDHIAIQRNGDINHLSANNLAGPIAILSTSDNIEDNTIHKLRIKWNATTKILETYSDGVLRLTLSNDLVNTTFGGNPMVYWGFTGATGGENNLQRFCTALSPNWKSLDGQKRCAGSPITFTDSTISFTAVAKFYWDFGDGSNIDSVNQNPVHTYTTAGNYNVSLKVRGADGCEATKIFSLRIGSKPVAGFRISDSCITANINFTDTSRTTVGTINNWYWDLDNGTPAYTVQNPSALYTTYGVKHIRLAVKSLEGCISDTLDKLIRIRSLPVPDFTFTDSVCLGSPTNFFNATIMPDGLPVEILWHLNGSDISTASTPQYTFSTPGSHSVLLVAGLNNMGSCSKTITKNVFVVDKPRAGIKKPTVCELQQFRLQDSSYTTDGIAISGWWWDLGNGQFSTQQNPSVTYNGTSPVTIRHVARNARGCISDTMTFVININPKPVAKFGVGEALCNNNKVQFSDSSIVASGAVTQWLWINSDTIFSTAQHTQALFPAGTHQAGLVVITAQGCRSDTVFHNFTIKTKPNVAITYEDACKFAPVNFTAAETTTNIGITNWEWIFGDGTVGSGAVTSHIYNANGNYTVKLVGTSTEGCFSDTSYGVVNIYGTNAFAGDDIIAAAGEPVQLHAIGGLSYLWTPGAPYLNHDDIADPVAILTETQIFHLKAFTPEGCESYDDVKVDIYKGPDFYLPSAFTPNGDGLNDRLRGQPVGIQKFNYMRVFNRWGQLLYSSSDMNRGWDGRFKGEEQAAGTYVVLISAVDFRGKLIEKKMTVQLIR